MLQELSKQKLSDAKQIIDSEFIENYVFGKAHRLRFAIATHRT